MMVYKFLFLTVLLCWSSAAQLDVNGKDITPVTPDAERPKTTSSTTTSTTTTTTSTTAAPDTTTSSTTSTTSSSTSTSTSTVAPPTTTTAKPEPTTTHAPPAPYPDPSVGHWNSSCIKLDLAAQLNFTYETKDGNKTWGLYNLPVNATVGDSDCGSGNVSTIETIQLSWGPKDGVHMMLLQFDKKNNSVVLSMVRVVLHLTPDYFPDAKENETISLVHRGVDFNTPEKTSYYCTRAQRLNMTMTVPDKEVVGILTVSHVHVEAFRSSNATGFSTIHDCDGTTSDVVPIAVGIALAALIVVVLISYLCARRRSTTRGYMSF